MRIYFRRALVALTATALGAVAVPAMTTDAAHAADADRSVVTFNGGIPTRGTYGSSIPISGQVNDASDSSKVCSGTVYLQRAGSGSKAYKNIASVSTSHEAYFGYRKLTGNARYRLYFPATAATTGTPACTASVSGVLHVHTLRTLKVSGKPGRKAHVRFKVGQNYKHKKLILQRKSGKHYKTIGRPRTDKHGVAHARLSGTTRGTKYRVIATGDKRFTRTQAGFTVTRSAY